MIATIPFGRFTPAAREAIFACVDTIADGDDGPVETTHLLRAVIECHPDAIPRLQLGPRFGAALVGEHVVPEALSQHDRRFSEPAHSVLGASLRQALILGFNTVAAEHILLVLSRTENGTAASILRDAGIDPSLIEKEITRVNRLRPGSARPAVEYRTARFRASH